MVIREESNVIFRFQFSPRKTKSEDFSYKVYSDDKNKMNTFLSQHNFDPSYVHIDCIPTYSIPQSEWTKMEEYMLTEFKFKSNMSPELYNIMTTRWLVSNAIDLTCSELSECLLMGPPSIRHDIEIFKIINDLINKLPHVFIMDQTLIDGDSGNYDNDEYENRYMNRNAHHLYDGFMMAEACEDSLIYESMYNESFDEEIQPITIESYVNGFTSLLFDKFV